MPIVDARALSYEQMRAFLTGEKVKISSQEAIQPHNEIRIISITDPEVPPLLAANKENVAIAFNYKDIEADCEPKLFTPSSEHMKFSDAEKIVKFVIDCHNSDKNILLLVNCMFGMARSGAIVDFVGNICGLGYWNTKRRNPQIVPNHWNQYLLFKAYFQRYEELGV